MDNFVTPHSHPQSLDTASTIEAFVKRELELGTGAITCTDHGTLAATRKVYDLAKKAKITPILGLEAYVRDDNCPILIAAGIPKTIDDDFKEKGETFIEYAKYCHLTQHYLDTNAFETACRLLSKAHENAEQHGSESKPIFTWNDLEELGATNTTFMSGCLIGVVQRHLLLGRPDIARKYYERIRSIAKPGNFYVEVFPHRCDKNWVQAVFLYNAAGEKIRYHPRKTLRVVIDGKKVENHAEYFVKRWLKTTPTNGPEKMTLVAVSHYRKWEDREPFEIAKMEHVEDFIQNECTEWAPDGDAQIGGNKFVLELAREFGDPTLVSDDSHYAYPEDSVVQDVRLKQSGSWRFYGNYARKTSEESFAYFKEHLGTSQAEFESWVENSKAWASRFKDFTFKKRDPIPAQFYPKDTLKHTLGLIKKHGRMDWNDPVWKARLNAELKMLHRNGTVDLLPYMMIGEEAVDLYEKAGELTGPGRGSAGGLSLAYLLNVTHVDPIKYQLSMDRFMTPDRIIAGDLPDVDYDLPHRELLVGTDEKGGWLQQRFGDHVAQISTDTSIKLKSAIKDVYRALHNDIPRDIFTLCKGLADAPQGLSDDKFVFGYEDNDQHVPGLIETDASLQAFAERYPEEWKIVRKCLGLTRNKSRHACAFLVASAPVSTFIPTQVIGDVKCTAYTAGSVEASGGLKMDFLQVHALKDIGACLRLVQQRHGRGLGRGPSNDEFLGHDFQINSKRVPGVRIVPFQGKLHDIWDLPEDQPVFRDICESKTESVFQFSTPGAKKWLKHFDHERPGLPGHKSLDSIMALATFTALDRPGPLDAYVGEPGSAHNMLVEYALRARGEPATGNLPVLDQLLPETYGVIVFQEQLQRVFQKIAETDGVTANAFRKHVSKKKPEEIMKDRALFMPKAEVKYGEVVANQVWNQLKTFGAYGFNLSHAVCYVVISYACAFLKHHYPLEWWTAVCANAERNEINDTFWQYCGKLIDLPDIKYSADTWEIQGERIRAPLSLLVGMGPKAHEEICAERPYQDIEDFCQKLENRKTRLGTTEIKTVEKKHRDRKTKEVTITTVEVPVLKKARSAVNKSTMATLIVSGAADGLFPADMSMLDKLSAYEAAHAKAQGKYRRDGSLKVEAVQTKYLYINQLVRFQMRKKMLPGYSESLLPLFLDTKVAGLRKIERDGKTRYEAQGIPFVGIPAIEHLNAMPMLPKPQTLALAAYISADRRFTYQDDKHAAELHLDVNGKSIKVVRWPSREGALPKDMGENLTGALVVALIKKRQGKDPQVIALKVVQPPLVEKNDEDEDKE